MKISKGTALILSLLMVGLITTIGLGIAKLSLSELKMARQAVDSTASYYAAEAGLEDGLLQFRYNRDVETGESPKEVDLGEGKKYQLKIWYRVATVGNFDNLDDTNNPILTKDQVREFDVEGLAEIILKYKRENIVHPDAGLEIIRVNAVTNEWDTELRQEDWLDGQPVSTNNVKTIRIKPWGCDIRYTISPGAGNKIDSGTTIVESTGSFKETKRKLRAEIDRKSGTILNVYDFLLWGGKEISD